MPLRPEACATTARHAPSSPPSSLAGTLVAFATIPHHSATMADPYFSPVTLLVAFTALVIATPLAIAHFRSRARRRHKSAHVLPVGWTYRVEGGEHMVFGRAPSNGRTVLRVRLASTPPPGFAANRVSRFASTLFKETPLAERLVPMIPAIIDETAAVFLAQAAAGLRPPHRTRKSRLPAPGAQACLQKDLARLFGRETYCVEVKPKAAWRARGRLVPPAICNTLRKFDIFEYHAKNYGALAVENDDVGDKYPELPRYTPSDLLSGALARVKIALEALRMRGERGLRVMRGGDILAASKEVVPPARVLKSFADTSVKRAVDVAARVLADNAKCTRFLRDVQGLDYLDKIGAEMIWDRLVKLLGGDERQAELRVWNEYERPHTIAKAISEGLDEELESWRLRVSYGSAEEAKELHDEKAYRNACLALDQMPVHICAKMIAHYMIAAVAKDCSIVVSMTPSVTAPLKEKDGADRDQGIVSDQDGACWIYQMHVIDLGPKPLAKIRKWAARDRQLATQIQNTKKE